MIDADQVSEEMMTQRGRSKLGDGLSLRSNMHGTGYIRRTLSYNANLRWHHCLQWVRRRRLTLRIDFKNGQWTKDKRISKVHCSSPTGFPRLQSGAIQVHPLGTICYLDDNGKPGKNFNRQLVDSSHAVIKDFKNNEFDPQSWW